MTIIVRKAVESDTQTLTDIRNEALAFKLSQGDTAWGEEPFTTAEVLTAIARDNLYVVLVDDRPAASVILHWRDEHTWAPKGLTISLPTSQTSR